MAAMRYQGRLKKWNAERGYGFIVASDSGQDIFVHITAFPRDGRVPMEGDEFTCCWPLWAGTATAAMKAV
ncbi:MAG TPA: cold shock domain-containing protein [Rhodoferax sp.]